MVLELYTPTVEDSRVLTEMIFAGFCDDPVSAMMYSVPAPEATIAASSKTLSDGWAKNPNEHWLCVKDSETGELLSHAQWFYVPPQEGEEWKKLVPRVWPDDWDKEFCLSVQEKNWSKRVEIMGARPHICK